MKTQNFATSRLRTLASQIRREMDAIASKLQNRTTRVEIASILIEHDENAALGILRENPQRLPAELVKGVVRDCPDSLDGPFEQLNQGLPPMAKICALLSRQALCAWVQLPENGACRLKDARLPLVDFKRHLLGLLFPKPSAQNQCLSPKRLRRK